MRYFYEYKEKKGSTVGGHNLVDIIMDNNAIILKCLDIVDTYDDYDINFCRILLNMCEIEYLKIMPISQEEK